MLIIMHPQAESKEPIKEAGKDQRKRKTANQESICQEERVKLGKVDNRAKCRSLQATRFSKCDDKSAGNLKGQVQWTVAEKPTSKRKNIEERK